MICVPCIVRVRMADYFNANKFVPFHACAGIPLFNSYITDMSRNRLDRKLEPEERLKEKSLWLGFPFPHG
eukprot:jgi/Psemu1/311107/fgenesh1_kg.721_\